MRTLDGPGHRLGHLQLLVPDLVPVQPASHGTARSKDRGRVQLRHAVSLEGKGELPAVHSQFCPTIPCVGLEAVA